MECVVRVVVYVEKMLMVGFIIVCDLGLEGVGYVDVGIWIVIEKGVVFGLRL